MENNEEKILKEIEYVLSHNTENKSFLITGSWGIGKTYFFQNELKQRIENNGYIVIEISLLGIKDIFSLKDKILIEYFSKTDKNILSDYFRAFRKKLSSVFDINKIMKNIRDIKESIDSVKEDFGVNLLSKNAFDIIFSDSNEKIFFCFDDCERIADSIFLKEFFSILNSFNHCKNIAFLAIGNMAKFSNEDEFNLYKEKIFFRKFCLKKEETKIADILLNKYKESFIPHKKIEDIIARIVRKEDDNLEKMNKEERDIYDKSKDLYSNMRVLSDILYILNRSFKCLNEKRYTLSDDGTDNIIASFFFFGILFNSSEKIKKFNFYSENSLENEIIATLLPTKEKTEYLYFEILSNHISVSFKKLRSAYDYFNEGYFNEDKFLEEISVYRKSELSRFLEQELEDINGKAFYLSFIADNDRLKNLREKLLKEIKNNSKEISFETAQEIITIIVISNIFLEKTQRYTEDIENLFKHLSDTTIEDLSAGFSFGKNGSSSQYVEKYKKEYKKYIDFLTTRSEQRKEQKISKEKEECLSSKNSKMIREYFEKISPLSDEDSKKVIDFILFEIQNNEFKPHFQDFVRLCRMPSLKEQLLERFKEFQKNPPQGIRKEFFEWIIFLTSNS